MGFNPQSTVAHRLLGRLSLAIVLAVGTLTLVGFGGRLGWLPELACHFRVQYFWLLSLGALGLATCKWWRLAAASAALAFVNLVLIAPLYFGPASPMSDRSVTRAMSQNLFWHNRDHASALALVAAERPDFVLFLEVTPEWADALGALTSEYPYWRSMPSVDSGGIALYSRRPFEEIKARRFEERDPPGIIAEIELPEGRFTLIGVHPASPISPEHFHFRNRQFRGIARQTRELSGAKMLLGDLNTTSWSPFFQDLLRDSGLADSRRGFGVQATWPNLPLLLRIPIDHCLISPEIELRDRRIGPAIGSDHRAVIVDFTLRKSVKDLGK